MYVAIVLAGEIAARYIADAYSQIYIATDPGAPVHRSRRVAEKRKKNSIADAYRHMNIALHTAMYI